jgi:hypothetical protein
MTGIKHKLFFELTWWALTIVVLLLILLPIWFAVENNYGFYRENIITIIIAITFGRYLFFLKHHWMTASKWYKLIFVFLPVGVFFFLMDSYYDFQRFCDEEGLHSIMDGLSPQYQNQMAIYIKTQMTLFWSAAFISNILLPFKMTRSIYRKLKKGID